MQTGIYPHHDPDELIPDELDPDELDPDELDPDPDPDPDPLELLELLDELDPDELELLPELDALELEKLELDEPGLSELLDEDIRFLVEPTRIQTSDQVLSKFTLRTQRDSHLSKYLQTPFLSLGMRLLSTPKSLAMLYRNFAF